MKKILILLISLSVQASAAYLVNLDAGQLKVDVATALNSSASPNGSLLVLVAAGGDSSFSNTLALGQYVSGNDIVLAIGSFNTNGGQNETNNVFSNISVGTLGDNIALRWFPNITLAQYEAGVVPSAGSSYGTYYPGISDGIPTGGNPDGGDNWVIPSDGAAISLTFYTTDSDGGGTQAPSLGYANFQVVPEPSSFVLLGAGLVFLLPSTVRRRLQVL